MDDELLAKGREIQTKLWPHMKTSSGPFPAAKLAPDFYRYVAETAFGMIWSPPRPRPARPQPRDRRPARRPRQDRRAPRPPGRRAQQRLTKEELVEVLMQTAVYAGVPAANEALGVAADVFGVE